MSDKATVAVVNLDLPDSTISRHIYGHFAEHLGRCIYGGIWVGEDSSLPNIEGMRTEIIEALRDIKIPNLRWPGGCFADEYHWRDGIGPKEDRARVVNTHWGDVVEDNSFGTHEFMRLCELLETEAYVNGNVGSGTVQEMSEWIEYLTRDGDSPMAMLRRENGRDKPWKVPFFGIGNESWGCGGNMNAKHYANLARQYATYVRDHDGNKVTRIAAGANRDDFQWTEELMKNIVCSTCMDTSPAPYQAISLHYYSDLREDGPSQHWFENARTSATEFTTEEWYKTMLLVQDFGRIIAGHATIMDKYDPEKLVGLVVDEWGTWWDVEPGTNPGFLYQQNTMRDALVASMHFDIFHKQADRISMANIAQTVNVLQAMILTDPETGKVVLTPTYYVFKMNVPHQDAEHLPVGIASEVPSITVDGKKLPLISLSASRKDGSALISLTNLDIENEHTVKLDIRGGNLANIRGVLLTGDEPGALNTFEDPDRVVPTQYEGFTVSDLGASTQIEVTLPPHSYVTLQGDMS